MLLRSLVATLLLAMTLPGIALADEAYHVNNATKYAVWFEVKEQTVDHNRVGFCTNPFSGNQKWLKHSENRKGPNAGKFVIYIEHRDCKHPIIWEHEYWNPTARWFTVSGSEPRDFHVATGG